VEAAGDTMSKTIEGIVITKLLISQLFTDDLSILLIFVVQINAWQANCLVQREQSVKINEKISGKTESTAGVLT